VLSARHLEKEQGMPTAVVLINPVVVEICVLDGFQIWDELDGGLQKKPRDMQRPRVARRQWPMRCHHSPGS
jgi:hypothetical protein